MPTSADYSNRPSTHKNNAGQDQAVDKDTQQFTSTGSSGEKDGKEEAEAPKLKADAKSRLLVLKARVSKLKTKGIVRSERTLDNYEEWLPEMLTPEFCQNAKNNNFHYLYHSNGYQAYGQSSFFVNELSKQQYVGFHQLTKAQFDEMLRTKGFSRTYSWVNDQNNPFKDANGKFVLSYRGIYSSKLTCDELLDGYFGVKKMDFILMPGNEDDAIYTSPNHDTAEVFGHLVGSNDKDHYIIRMLISPDAKVMTDKQRQILLQKFRNNRNKFAEAIRKTVEAQNINFDKQDIDKLEDLIFNSITHTETALPVMLGYDVYLREHICVLNGRHVYSERESYDKLKY